ncbi:MAG: hypothetical protein QME96_10330 [Myxococcota bacterium]|nr:hypothetical protein [Myxococcota bacterium]
MIVARDVVDAYLAALAAGGEAACRDYCLDPRAWTARACLALVDAGRREFPVAEGATRPRKDTSGRSEYLTTDVMLWDEGSWGPPLFVAEHEQSGDAWQVQYSAWKLLVVEARRRVLVAYFGEGTGIRNLERLGDLVREVCRDNKGKDITIIAAPCNARPRTSEELRSMHESMIVGEHP